MIFENIAWQFYYKIASFLNFSIDSFDGLVSITNFFNSILNYGIDIYKYFIPPAGQVILTVIIAAHLAVNVYFIVMWILKKIPLLGIQ